MPLCGRHALVQDCRGANRRDSVEKEECTIIGHRKKTSRLYAALANGTFAHGLEFDNAHWSHVHAGPPTVSAALSIARGNKDLAKTF